MSELTKKRNTKKVLNKTTGETYDSLKQAAEKLDVNYTRLSTHVKGTLIIKNFPYELEYIDTKENQ